MNKKEIRIGKIPYLNAVPFYQEWRLPCVWRPGAPRYLVKLAQKGEIDAAPLPLVALPELSSRYEPLGKWCISVNDAAHSVLLISRRQIKDLTGCRIGLTEESTTSVSLLQVLLQERFNVPTQMARGFSAADDARLIIGDDALRFSQHKNLFFPHIYDLGMAWHEWQHLPFVFARWVVKKSLSDVWKKKILQAVRQSHRDFWAKGKDSFTSTFRKPRFITSLQIWKYLNGFNYILGEQEEKACQQFTAYLKRQTGVIK